MPVDELDGGGVARNLARAQEQNRTRRAAARDGLDEQRRIALAASRLLPRVAAKGEHVDDGVVLGDAEGHQKFRQALLERGGEAPTPVTALVLARTCGLVPEATADPQQPARAGLQR